MMNAASARRPSCTNKAEPTHLGRAPGIGKTTNVAELAGLCAQKHGAANVGMTVGTHQRLREYARNLGLLGRRRRQIP